MLLLFARQLLFVAALVVLMLLSFFLIACEDLLVASIRVLMLFQVADQFAARHTDSRHHKRNGRDDHDHAAQDSQHPVAAALPRA